MMRVLTVVAWGVVAAFLLLVVNGNNDPSAGEQIQDESKPPSSQGAHPIRIRKQADGTITSADLKAAELLKQRSRGVQWIPLSIKLRLTSRDLDMTNPKSSAVESFRATRAQMVERLRDMLMSRAMLPDSALSGDPTSEWLTIQANEAAIQVLLDDPDVVQIEEPAEWTISLDGTTQQIGAVGANNSGWTGAGQTIVVIDSGVQSGHPMLSGKTAATACSNVGAPADATLACPSGSSFTAGLPGEAEPCVWTPSANPNVCRHGTGVAGVAVGNATGSPPLRGVAPHATLIPIQVFYRKSNGEVVTNAAAVTRALTYTRDVLQHNHEIAAINISAGGAPFSAACDSEPVADAISGLRQDGIPVVVSSGNDGLIGQVTTPACVQSATTIAATTKSSPETIPDYANLSSYIDLLAPGGSEASGIRVPAPTSTTLTGSGTSLAAPHVAGGMAVLQQISDFLSFGLLRASPGELETLLYLTGTPVTGRGFSHQRIALGAAIPRVYPQPEQPICYIDVDLTRCNGSRREFTVSWLEQVVPVRDFNVEYKYSSSSTWLNLYGGPAACLPLTPSANATMNVRVRVTTGWGGSLNCQVSITGSNCSGEDNW